MYKIAEDERLKVLTSPNYNYMFSKNNGAFIRTGKTLRDDPEWAPFGPEIIDMEISTICSNRCSFCYKTNTSEGKNMSLETFKEIFDKLPDTVTQIAFGIGDIDANPDLWKIMEYSREHGIIPNITVNGLGITDNKALRLASVCGAVAVSHYNTPRCFNTVLRLTKLIGLKGITLKQVNIHKLLSEQTYLDCSQLLRQAKYDVRLVGLNAIVFLWLKPKGDRNIFDQIDKEQYHKLIDEAFRLEVSIGFDSCSAPMFIKEIKGKENYKEMEKMVDSCESTLFSYYINVDGMGYPCSFSEGLPEYEGIDILQSKDFIKDVWLQFETANFRDKCICSKDENGCRKCMAYDLGW